MSKAHLGEVFDIHGGGLDLIFPHHENEIAQSRCANGEHGTDVMANYWMHNGFLQVEGEKMSKSLGNFITINEALKQEHGDIARFNMLKTHYRQPIDWTRTNITESFNTLAGWERLLRMYGVDAAKVSPALEDSVADALFDDLNTPLMIAALHRLANEKQFEKLGASLKYLGFQLNVDHDFAGQPRGIAQQSIKELIKRRLAARKAKDWTTSDQIRDELAIHRIQIKDIKDPVTGEPDTEWDLMR